MLKNFIKKHCPKAAALGSSLFASGVVMATDLSTGATDVISTDGTDSIGGVGTALIALAGTAVVYKWVKGAIFS